MTNNRKITTAVWATLGPLSKLLATFSHLTVPTHVICCCFQFLRWFLSESRPALYRSPVFLSKDPNATLSPSAISHV